MDSISCPICLDLLKDPVGIPCGHSYCMGCIKDCWDQDDQKGIYSCPLCKESFIPRPVLRKNNLLAELVEDRKKTGLQASRPAHFYAGPGDVACDVCTGRKQKALKSCLVCLASYCETHLLSHYESPALKKHKLVEASSQLQDKICSRHDKVLEVFCRTDQQCICYLCSMDEHKGHDTVSAAAERTEKQRQLGLGQQNVQQREKREKELKKLQQVVKSFKRSGQAAEQDSERIFTGLIRSIERRRSEVKELIRAQQRAAVSEAEGLVERLEKEIAELRRRDAELEKLSHTEDHIHFLQSYQSLSSPSVSPDLPSISVPPLQYFSHVTKSVSELREKLEDVIKAEWSNISSTVSSVDVFLPPEPRTRAHFLHSMENKNEETCPICMDTFKNVKLEKLKCSHEFCRECLIQAKKVLGPICPVCKDVFGKIEGDQPPGHMTTSKERNRKLPGFNCGTITIHYDIPSGRQTERHPNPGKRYYGAQRTAYLPDNEEGNEVLMLLKRAFDQKLIFTVGTSRTSGQEDCVTWNDIHHKTNTSGGPECFGYPDPGYMTRVKDELKAKGIE